MNITKLERVFCKLERVFSKESPGIGHNVMQVHYFVEFDRFVLRCIT